MVTAKRTPAGLQKPDEGLLNGVLNSRISEIDRFAIRAARREKPRYGVLHVVE
jgi:hypothetical protein